MLFFKILEFPSVYGPLTSSKSIQEFHVFLKQPHRIHLSQPLPCRIQIQLTVPLFRTSSYQIRHLLRRVASTYLPLYRVHQTVSMRPPRTPFEVYLSDFLEEYPVLSLDLGVPVLRHLLILLLVDEHGLSRLVVRDWLHYSKVLPVSTQVLISPLASENLRRTRH